MVRTLWRKRAAWLGLAMLVGGLALAVPAAFGADAERPPEVKKDTSLGEGIRIAGLAIAAGIAITGAALGTARVQAAVGASGTGAMAEKPEMWTYVLVLFAVPETLVVFGFVVGILLITRI